MLTRLEINYFYKRGAPQNVLQGNKLSKVHHERGDDSGGDYITGICSQAKILVIRQRRFFFFFNTKMIKGSGVRDKKRKNTQELCDNIRRIPSFKTEQRSLASATEMAEC